MALNAAAKCTTDMQVMFDNDEYNTKYCDWWFSGSLLKPNGLRRGEGASGSGHLLQVLCSSFQITSMSDALEATEVTCAPSITKYVSCTV